MNKLVTILLIISLLLLSTQVAFAQEKPEAPETTEELKEFGRKFLEALPQALKAAWGAAVDVWQRIWGWFKNLWNSYIFPWLKSIWQKIWSVSKKEFEKRKPILGIEEEPEEEIPEEKENLWKKLWQRIKTLIK